MPEYIWVPALIIIVVWALYKGEQGRKTRPQTGQDAPADPAPQESACPKEPTVAPTAPPKRCPIPVQRTGAAKKPLEYDILYDRIQGSKARAVLRSLDAYVPATSKEEAHDVAELVDECFAELAGKLAPHATLKLYDDLRAKSPAFAAATEDGATDAMRLAFEESLDNPLPQKNAKKLALGIARCEHPLVMALVRADSRSMSDFLDRIAEEAVEGWESADLPDMSEADLCARLCALLDGSMTAEELRSEFSALEKNAEAASRASGRLRVKSSSGRRSYELDPARATCTCPDWQERRSGVPEDKPDRLCKHLVRLYRERPELVPPGLARFAPLFPAIDKGGMPSNGRYTKVQYGERNDAPYILTHETGKAWANLYLDGVRYGYNDAEKRWSYGKVPDDAKFWARELKKFAAD